MILFIILWNNSNCIILRKDDTNNLLKLQVKNIFCYPITSLMFDVQNIIGEIKLFTYKSRKRYETKNYSLLIVNKCKNINFNDNYIPLVQEKLFHIYGDLKINDNINNNKLAEFVDSCPDENNPVFFNELTYMGSSSTEISVFYNEHIKLSRIMRMNKKFFSYFIDVEGFTLCPIIFTIIMVDLVILFPLIGLTIAKIYLGTIITSIILFIVDVLIFIHYYKKY